MDLLADIELRSLLAECRAHLVARTPAQLRALESLARKTGFRSAVHGPMPSLHGERSVIFYFFHFQIGEPALSEMMTAIRTSADATIRFAPAIVIIGDCYMSDVVRYVGQGFDDIVTLPEKAAILERRFAPRSTRRSPITKPAPTSVPTAGGCAAPVVRSICSPGRAPIATAATSSAGCPPQASTCSRANL